MFLTGSFSLRAPNVTIDKFPVRKIPNDSNLQSSITGGSIKLKILIWIILLCLMVALKEL